MKLGKAQVIEFFHIAFLSVLERALEQDYAAFRDQVLPFLEPGAAELLASPGAWEQIQTLVVDRLESAR